MRTHTHALPSPPQSLDLHVKATLVEEGGSGQEGVLRLKAHVGDNYLVSNLAVIDRTFHLFSEVRMSLLAVLNILHVPHLLEQCSHLLPQHPHLLVQYPHLIVEYLHLPVQYPHPIVQYPHPIVQYPHLLVQYPHLLVQCPNLRYSAMECSNHLNVVPYSIMLS